MMRILIINTFICFGFIAVLDVAWQRYSHIKGLMMSMDEIKQEYKQMEGDPHMKGHRKELAREIALGEMVENTRKASVVVTNPTHVAVALYYEEGKTPLPVVLSKGEGHIAEAIKRVAEEEGIPVLQNIPLARALLGQAQLGQYIPTELIEPVAELLLALRKMAEQRAQEDFDG
jgi:type III secretion protein U